MSIFPHERGPEGTGAGAALVVLEVVVGVVGGVVTVRTTVWVWTTVSVFVLPPQPAASRSATSDTGRRAGRKIGAG